ncbi:DUF192 domain-containing protein [Ammoniphilus sp. CFH 90114]|uniref:DUF192 domain-containing protein n=1 Tax=Ammoniphilus sp. CFH 90114 TaxID=2493665 RepID=UPI0013E944ED|nr:DUF192 domain-containing protein [Ammoniphilus sp. CFH 90114]
MKIQSFHYTKRNTEQNLTIELETAFTFARRFFGLMGRGTIQRGILFNRTKQVHMFFMRFPIDVYFLNQEGVVIRIVKDLRPWRISPYVKEAYYVIELQVGHPYLLEIGDVFQVS